MRSRPATPHCHDATYAALLAGGTDDDRRDLMLVFSDGWDTASWLSSDTVLQSARRSDVVVYGLSLRGSPSTRFLSALGAATGGDALTIETTRHLRERFLSILGEFRERYLVSYSPEGVPTGRLAHTRGERERSACDGAGSARILRSRRTRDAE